MSKIYSLYKDNLDKAWYDSSNILYSECDDHDNALKTVRITFKDGRTYRYDDVDVNHYVRFRESQSQGQVFHQLFKEYKYEKIENKDVQLLKEELHTLLNPNEITLTSEKITIGDLSIEINEETYNTLCKVFEKLGLVWKQ